MTELFAERFRHDPAIQQAKSLILDALSKHQSQIKAIAPPNPEKAIRYDDYLKAFEESRGSPLWFRYIGSGLGNGALVELLDGSIKYDLICGIGPHFFGHSHPALIEACLEGALSDIVNQGNLQQNEEPLELMQLLTRLSGMDHCFLSSTGVMANENALKIAFQKRFPASRIFAFEKCFMGRTLAASQITDKAQFREGLPATVTVDYLPFYDANDPKGSTECTIQAMKKQIQRYPNQHAILCFEPVQGEAGFFAGTTEFFNSVLSFAKEHNIITFCDEVQTFGRTLELFAFHYYKVEKLVDMVSIGKISQTCATLYRKELNPKPGLLSQTFISSSSALKASVTLIKALSEGGYYGPNGKNAAMREKFLKVIQSIAERHPDLIKGPFGVGMMIAFTPYDGSSEKSTKLVKTLFDKGIICFVAGSNPTRVRFLPPIEGLHDNDFPIIENILEEALLECRE